MQAERQRLFFALWPTPEQRAALVEAAARLPDELGRRVSADNLHLTLLFLGGLTPEQREAMEAVADDIVVPPFTLTFDEFGYWRRPQVVWLGSRAMPAELRVLVKYLQQGAASAGLIVDSRPYTIHLTLYRKARRAPRRWSVFAPLNWSVTEFALVESLSEANGMRYEVRRSWPLTGAASSISEWHSVE